MRASFPALYAILDPDLVTGSVEALAAELASAGVQLIQLRDKHSSARRIYEPAGRLSALLSPRGVRFIVNDRPDIAAMVGAGGVHVGQDDMPAEEARKICRTPSWVGVSTHNPEQLRAADATSADYIAVGPIFRTGTKENPDPVVGLEFVRLARVMTTKPLVAIGGITLDTAPDVWRAGADSVAIIRDLIASPDPAQRARDYLGVAERVRAEQGG
ncbi:MAG TPA: thiamine phosphate synthase [Verrucomicrobiae bacterium]|nr:thiamine phosphate synthase [Verrucomicrobiae bacterium]